MRIAVIGAGIGGLAVAVGLQADAHEVTVFERQSSPSAIGAGLTLFGNAFDALDVLGLGEAVRSISSGAIASMRSGQQDPSGKWLLTVPQGSMTGLRSVHRVELHQTLLAHLAPGSLHFGASALIAQDGSPRVSVDETMSDFDLVIVADGIRSRNRTLLGLDPGLHYAGYTAWRGVTNRPVDLRGEAGETWGHGQLFGIVPLPDDRVYWFGTLSTAPGITAANEHEQVCREFTGWHDPIQECLQATDAQAVLRHDIYDLAKPVSSLTRGRTVLLGDAAHAMTPNLGQGAGQALEDAATLVLLLRGNGAKEVPGVLARYESLRQRRTSELMRRSRTAGRLAQASNPLAVGLRNTALRLMPGIIMGTLSQRMQRWPRPGQ
ncbi:FAD-dependent monooxygenase [Glutamicibacter sp. NPDC087344]|uniref:FAD-dependent monooxygenase n=1 Tax=Glutamicibacter sp. NPDC087344 TaxID=3363994 RepID=UPI003821A61F